VLELPNVSVSPLGAAIPAQLQVFCGYSDLPFPADAFLCMWQRHAVFCRASNGSGCGAAPVNSGPEFLYATSNRHGGEILAFPIYPNSGALAAPTSTAAPLDVSGMAAAQRHFLYGSDPQTGVNAFSIDQSSGILSLVPGSPFSKFGTSHFSPGALVAAPTAVYANDWSTMTGFTIGTTGALTRSLALNSGQYIPTCHKPF
jgi:hypothetical protein